MTWLLLLLLLGTAAADHYQTLSVPRKATLDDIKSAYRKLARVHHPDKPDGCPERFRKINEAHEVLSDPQRRREYDARLDNPFGQHGGGSPFAQQHGGFPAGGGFAGPGFSWSYSSADPFAFRRSAPREDLGPFAPAVRSFSCSLDELDAGCSKTIVLKDSWLSRLRDAVAEGKSGPAAQVTRRALQQAAMVVASLLWQGRGWLIFDWGRWWYRLPLLAAAFVAYLAQQLPPSPEGTFDIKVRPGWRAGTKVTFAREPRHVTFRLREATHRGLHRRRHDLVFKARLTRAAAARGVTLAVPRLNGEAWSIELEPGEALEDDGGYTRRFSGGGMPIKGGPARGDLLVEVKVVG